MVNFTKNVLTKYKINYRIKASEEIYRAISGEIPTRVYRVISTESLFIYGMVVLCAFYYIKCKINILKYYAEI